jgi:hypothetical protein
MREFLFGDVPLSQWARPAKGTAGDAPWSTFTAAEARLQHGDRAGAIAEFTHVLSMPGLGSRQYLQAGYFLRQLGALPPEAQARALKGVVVEVARDEGLDIVAAYEDHTARSFHHSGASVIWEAPPDPAMDHFIDTLLKTGQRAVDQTGPWEGPRPPTPPRGDVRINLLTLGGMYFGQGELAVMAQDDLGGPVLRAALALMQALMARVGQTTGNQ